MMAPLRPKLKDVAECAGVSIATASIALRGLPSELISEQTRRRVEDAARELGYRHNALASCLRKGKTDIVAFLVNTLSSPALAVKLAAAEHALQQEGVRPVFWHTAGRPEIERKALNDIRSLMVSGLIVGYEIGPQGAELLGEFAEEGIPVVTFFHAEGIGAHVVRFDVEAAIYMATRHLLSLGHERVGLTGYKAFLDVVNGCGRGYARAHLELGLPVSEELIYHLPGNDTYSSGYAVGKRILDTLSRPTALVSTDDEVAIGVIRACRERGVKIPEELALVGFDDLPVAAFTEVPLTTVKYPSEEAGRRAAEILLRDMKAGKPGTPDAIVLQPELIVRESCGARKMSV